MKKLKRFWDRQSLKSKFLLIIVPGSIFASMMIMIMANLVFGAYEEKLYRVARQNLNLVVRQIEDELNEAEDMAIDIMTNNTVQKGLKDEKVNIRRKRITMDYIRMEQQVYKVMQSELGKAKNVVSVSLFVEDEWYYLGREKRSYDRSLLEKVGYDMARDGERMVWCAPSYPASCLYGIQTIRDIYYGTFEEEAVLVVEYDLEGSLNRLRQQPQDPRLMEEFMIYNGEAVIYSDVTVVSEMEWEKDIDYKIIKVDGKRYFASYLGPSSYGWKYVFLVSYDNLFGGMQAIKYFFFLFALGMTGVSILYCQKLSQLIVNRFRWLLGRMETVKTGSLSVERSDVMQSMTEGMEDELAEICSQFEDMVEALDKQIQDNYVKQMLIKENQLKVLQNQINPHFLFNTLQTINWKAKASQDEETSKIVEALGKLLRYTLKSQDDPAPLEKEVEILKHYVFIQQMRYGERLSVEIAIPDEMRERMVPKLSLQNIVENSIKHALENMLKPCEIRVWAEEEDEGYRVCVEDNGPGIHKEQLPGSGDMRNRNDDKETGKNDGKEIGQDDSKEAGLGIGLRNIQGRLRLLFGERSSLKICNTGHGTLVELYIEELGDSDEKSYPGGR